MAQHQLKRKLRPRSMLFNILHNPETFFFLEWCSDNLYSDRKPFTTKGSFKDLHLHRKTHRGISTLDIVPNKKKGGGRLGKAFIWELHNNSNIYVATEWITEKITRIDFKVTNYFETFLSIMSLGVRAVMTRTSSP